MDLAITPLSNEGFDLALDQDDVRAEGGLNTAVLMSIFSNLRIDEEGGYWADYLADITGDRLGSNLWRLSRGRNDQDNRLAMVSAIEDALAWLVEDSVAESVEVELSQINTDRVTFGIKINNFTDDRDTAFNLLWDVHRSRITDGQTNN